MKSMNDRAKELYDSIFWKYEKYNSEVRHNVCMISGRGLASELAIHMHNSEIEARLESLRELLCDAPPEFNDKAKDILDSFNTRIQLRIIELQRLLK